MTSGLAITEGDGRMNEDGRIRVARSITGVAKLAKSFGDATIPKVSATVATTKSDTFFSNDATRASWAR